MTMTARNYEIDMTMRQKNPRYFVGLIVPVTRLPRGLGGRLPIGMPGRLRRNPHLEAAARYADRLIATLSVT